MRCVIVSGILWFGLVVGCGSSGPRAVSAVGGLPEYSPSAASIFGDTLSSTVFGLPPEIPIPDDSKLTERAQQADAIVPVRVSTVSEESLAGVRGYSISILPDGKPVAGSSLEGSTELHIGPGNPSLSRVQTADATLIGRHFILFAKRYADDGEPALHFHGEADSAEIRKFIDSAKALDAVGDRVQTTH